MDSLGFFKGLYFSLNIIHLPSNQRKEIQEIIKNNGGIIVIGIPKETTHLVVGDKDILDDSLRARTAYIKSVKVVLPQFIFDCATSNKKLDEWKYFLIKGEDPTKFGSTEEDFVLNCLTEGFLNIQSIIAETKIIEDSISKTLTQISALCVGVIISYGEVHKSDLSSLTDQMFDTIQLNENSFQVETPTIISYTSEFGKKKPEQQNSLSLSIAIRNKQREDKLHAQNLKNQQREEEKMKKEIERKIREKEREMKIEQNRIKLEKEKIKREEERLKVQREFEVKSAQFRNKFGFLDSELEIESEIDYEELEKNRLEKMKEEEKERKQIIKTQKAKIKKETLKIINKEHQEERKHKKEERLRKEKEENERITKEKEIARIEYKERHEKKALKEKRKSRETKRNYS